MKKILFLILIIGFIVPDVNAQQVVVHGYLKDSVTHLPIRGGTITNLRNNKKIITEPNGYFKIEASPNDFVFVMAKSYEYDTLTFTYLSKDTLTIYLAPSANLLPTVTVKAQYTKYQSDSAERKAAFEAGVGKKMNTISGPSNSGFGITVNLDKFFKEKHRNRKKSEDLFEDLENTAYVDYRFSPYLVSHYTGFKGANLLTFMQRYTPSYSWLRSHPTNEDVMYYINDKLKEFKGTK